MVVLTERMYVQRTSVLHIHGACLVFRLDMKQTYIPALISYGCSSAGDSHPDSVSCALVDILNFFILVHILPQISVSMRYIILHSFVTYHFSDKSRRVFVYFRKIHTVLVLIFGNSYTFTLIYILQAIRTVTIIISHINIIILIFL